MWPEPKQANIQGKVLLLVCSVDTVRQQVICKGRALPLTPVEYRLLVLLLSRPGQVFARARMLDHLHQDFRDVSDRAIDSHIKNIRRKLDQCGVQDTTIASVYGVGYRYDVAG
jgi:two-component system response regulator BaeR